MGPLCDPYLLTRQSQLPPGSALGHFAHDVCSIVLYPYDDKYESDPNAVCHCA